MNSEKRLKSLRNWITSSDYDIETAEHMLQTGRYLYVIFMCHLALEKMLKAHVEFVEDKMPPKIHDLVTLAKRAKLQIPQPHDGVVVQLNLMSVPTRYPEDLQKSLADFTHDYSQKTLKETKEALKWLKNHPRFDKLWPNT